MQTYNRILLLVLLGVLGGSGTLKAQQPLAATAEQREMQSLYQRLQDAEQQS